MTAALDCDGICTSSLCNRFACSVMLYSGDDGGTPTSVCHWVHHSELGSSETVTKLLAVDLESSSKCAKACEDEVGTSSCLCEVLDIEWISSVLISSPIAGVGEGVR